MAPTAQTWTLGVAACKTDEMSNAAGIALALGDRRLPRRHVQADRLAAEGDGAVVLEQAEGAAAPDLREPGAGQEPAQDVVVEPDQVHVIRVGAAAEDHRHERESLLV